MNQPDSLVLELVLRWEEAAESGKSISLDEICREHPELLPAVRERVAALKSLTPLLATDTHEDDGAVARRDAESGGNAVGEIRYETGKVHARGGLGEVLLADDTALHRPVALKRMRDRCRRDAGARQRFLREAEITSQLQHPGVVPVYGFARDEAGDPVYAMRFVAGTTLHEAAAAFHADGQPDFAAVSFRQLLTRFVAVCQTIAYAHSRGIIHRDLKPANIMLGAFGETIVLDWGLAKRVGNPEVTLYDSAIDTGPPIDDATHAGDVLGTPAFMSPEQASGASDLGPASDVFSLGAVLYVLLTGRTPYSHSDKADLLDRVRRGEFKPPRSVENRVPKPLDAICRAAMAREPSARYTSTQALATEVERWLAGDVPTAYRESVFERSRRWARRHRTLVNALAATILVGAVAAGVAAALLYREQKATAAERDRADANFALADQTAGELQAAVIDHPRLKEADFHETRRDLLRRTVPLYEQLVAQKPDDEKAQFNQAVTLFRLGQIQHEFGEEAAALERMSQARERLEALLRTRPGHLEYELQLGRCDLERGQYLYQTGKLRDAETAFLAALDRFAGLSNSRESAERMARARNNLGLIRHSLGKRDEAAADFQAALSWQTDAPAGSGQHHEYLAFRALVLSNHSILMRDLRQYPQGIKALGEALEILVKLTSSLPDYPSYQVGLAHAELNLSAMLTDLRETPERAEEMSRAAVARLDAVSRRLPAIVGFRLEHARAQDSLARILIALRKADEAEKLRVDAIERLRKLLREHPDLPEIKTDLATALVNLGSTLLDKGDGPGAGKAFLEGIAHWDEVLRIKPDDIEARVSYRESIGRLGNLYYLSQRHDDAESTYRRQLDLYRAERRDRPDDASLIEGEAQANMNLGNVASGRRKFAASLPYFTAGLRLAEPLLAGRSRGETAEIVRNCHWGLADSLVQLNRHAEAILHWERMIQLIKSPKNQAEFRIQRALALARSGEADKAVAEVDELEKAALIAVPQRGDAAAIYSLASAKAADAMAREALQQKAIASLRSANNAKAMPVTFPKSTDFAPLRARMDFDKLAAEFARDGKK